MLLFWLEIYAISRIVNTRKLSHAIVANSPFGSRKSRKLIFQLVQIYGCHDKKLLGKFGAINMKLGDK